MTPRGGGSMRVLVVEDEALVALEIETVLIMAGCDVVGIADNLVDALAIAARAAPMLAFVDVRLAGGDSGLEVAARLKAIGISSVFATGNCAAAAGVGLAIGCLHKPFSDDSLARTVAVARAVLAGEPPMDIPRALHLY